MVFDYKKIYKQMNFGITNFSDIKAGISTFGSYLKRADKELKTLRGQVAAIVDARNAFTEHLSR